VSEVFKWFSYGQYPLDIRRPILENKTTWFKTRNQAKMAKDIFVWVIPILLLVFGGVFLYWRKRK
jgi:ABC-2 type transport system permease protein